jgi:hypothetical protein
MALGPQDKLDQTSLDKLALRLEWCGGVFHPRDHLVSHKGLYSKTPKLNAQEQ